MHVKKLIDNLIENFFDTFPISCIIASLLLFVIKAFRLIVYPWWLILSPILLLVSTPIVSALLTAVLYILVILWKIILEIAKCFKR